MRNRLRLGAAGAIALGALLLATVLASPALAWRSNVTGEAKCLADGRIQVDYTVTAWQEGHDASVKVFYELNGEESDLPPGAFNDQQSSFSDHFVLPAGTHGSVTITAVAYWKDDGKSTDSSEPIKLPYKCKPTETTAPPTTAPPTTAPPTTTPPSSSVSPTTSLETTTSAAAGAATSTTSGGGQLPFTGNSSGPMLLAGIVLVGGGSLFLLISRARDGHATK